MGMGTNIIIILIVYNILLNIPCLSDTSSNFCYPTGVTLIKGLLEADTSIKKIWASTDYLSFWTAVILTAGLTGIIAGWLTGDALTGITIGIAGFLFTFITLPISVFQQTGVPFEITLLVGGTLSTMIIFSLISFVRGSEF